MLRAGLIAGCLVFPMSAQADVPPRVAGLIEALRYDDLVRIMREEGLGYGETLEADLFPGQGGALWDDTVSDIYAADRMIDVVAEALDAGMSDDAIASAQAFFTSDQGARILELELSARDAFQDTAVEEMAEMAYAAAAEDPDAFFEQVTTFIEINNLIEANVLGGMNSNAAFYLGLSDGGAMGGAMTEQDILADVYSQQDDIRADTTEWAYSYLLMAYRPLPEADLAAYIAFSESDAGQAMNAAMFEGFDTLFVDISRALGLASARFMAAEEL